jgi:hypothetical protein
MIASARNRFAAPRALDLERVVHVNSMVVYGSATGALDESSRLAGESPALDLDDMVAAVSAGLQRPGVVGGAFNVSNPDP